MNLSVVQTSFFIGESKNIRRKEINFGKQQGTLVVTFTVDRNFKFSKSSVVEIYSTSFIGGNALAIKPNYEDTFMAEAGDTLKGNIQKGMLESVTSGLKPLEIPKPVTLSGENVMSPYSTRR